MTSLIDRCEEAFVAVLTAPVGALATVVTSDEYNGKSLPVIICACDGSGFEDDPKGSGNFFLNWTITIKTRAVQNFTATAPADNPKTTSQTLIELVLEKLMVDDLADQLTAAVADFTAFPAGLFFNAPTSGQDETGAFWIHEISGRVYCCPSEIPA